MHFLQLASICILPLVQAAAFPGGTSLKYTTTEQGVNVTRAVAYVNNEGFQVNITGKAIYPLTEWAGTQFNFESYNQAEMKPQKYYGRGTVCPGDRYGGKTDTGTDCSVATGEEFTMTFDVSAKTPFNYPEENYFWIFSLAITHLFGTSTGISGELGIDPYAQLASSDRGGSMRYGHRIQIAIEQDDLEL